MTNLPILQELFESDSVIFLVIGFVIAIAIGLRLKKQKMIGIGAGISALVYVICEFASNVRSNFMAEILLLFLGTIALGCLLGFIVCLLTVFIKKNKV